MAKYIRMVVDGTTHLAVGHHLQHESRQVERVHGEAEKIARLLHEIWQPLMPDDLKVPPHHSWGEGVQHQSHDEGLGEEYGFPPSES